MRAIIGGGDDLADPQPWGRPDVLRDLHRCQAEHGVGQQRPTDPAEDLGDGVGGQVGSGQAGTGAAADGLVDGGYDGVEVGAGHGPEQQDQHAEPEHGGQTSRAPPPRSAARCRDR
jgi:hypothetical protein